MSQPLMSRYWVNQPSALQPDHKYNGLCVIAPRDINSEKVVTVYPVTGDCYSMRMSTLSLSPGWPKRLENSSPSC